MVVRETKYKVGKNNFGIDHKSILTSDCHSNPGKPAGTIKRNNGHITLVFGDGSRLEFFHSEEETTDTGMHWSDYTPEMICAAYELV